MSRAVLGLLGLGVLALALRAAPVAWVEPWGDEIFSLAMATGHSLEHPASGADPALGDYVEPVEPQARSYFEKYAAHASPPAGLRRILRAVFLSDTNPPLYYVLLAAWTRALGTGDLALRSFSLVWAILTLPVLWLVGRHVGGARVAWLATLLFVLSPVSIYYSAEGRMYSLLWFLGVLLAWLTFALADRGSRPILLAGWVLTGTAGLLSHYFFAFVWLGCAVWLLLYPGRAGRRWAVALDVLTVAAVLPWLLHVRDSLGLWRVTAGWLDGPLSSWQVLTAPFELAWGLLTWRSVMSSHAASSSDAVSAVAYAALAGILIYTGAVSPLFRHPFRLVWLWLLGACGGPVLFDLLRATHVAEVPRYAMAGLPAILLLVGGGLALAPARLRPLLAGLVLAGWLPGIAATQAPRPWVVYREVAANLARWAGPSDLVIVHSIPSGVVAMARSLRGDTPMASWVVQLSTRVMPDDMRALLRGRSRVALVKTHDLSKPNPAEPWLREHARLEREDRLGGGTVLYFGPREGNAILPRSSGEPRS